MQYYVYKNILRMKNLIIGNTSQLSHYFPVLYDRISSRNVQISNEQYNKVFFCFGEHRTFIETDEKMFTDINVDYTIKLIDQFKDSCNKIILYSTCELWNNCEGAVNLNIPFNYNYSPYIKSKEIIYNYLQENKENYPNVVILYPFNFNSPYRKPGFLFSKIIDSIINKRKIEIGDTYFYRDFIHPKYLTLQSMKAESDKLVGSGRLLHVNDFIRDLYKGMNLNYNDYVTENFNHNLKLKRKIFYYDSNEVSYTYDSLLKDTLEDIKKYVPKTF